jgi:hypothetical protein
VYNGATTRLKLQTNCWRSRLRSSARESGSAAPSSLHDGHKDVHLRPARFPKLIEIEMDHWRTPLAGFGRAWSTSTRRVACDATAKK